MYTIARHGNAKEMFVSSTEDDIYSEQNTFEMQSGMDFTDNHGWNPFSEMARISYCKNIIPQFKNQHLKYQPESARHYNLMATSMLGIAIERAVGKAFSEYLEGKVRKPLDMGRLTPIYRLMTTDTDSRNRRRTCNHL